MVVGALGLALYAQLKRVTAEDDPEEMMDRLESQLAELETRIKAMQKSEG